MKKIIILLVLALAFAVNADTTIVNTAGLSITPNNIQLLELFDGTDDVIEDSSYVTFGPYRMCGDRNEKSYKGFQFYSDSLKGTSPVAAIAYQLAWSSDTRNIVPANWVTVDTLDAVGSTGYTDLSSKAGRYVYFRIHNYDATADTMGFVTLELRKDN